MSTLFRTSLVRLGGERMKWILGYLAGAVLVFTPMGLRLLTRSEAVPQPLDQAAVAPGKMLFTHKWTANDPLSRGGDGLGPVFNANSCVECHFQGGLGGSGRLEHNVTTFFNPRGGPDGKPSQGVIHAFATNSKYQENLGHVNPAFGAVVRPNLQQLEALRNTHFDGTQITQRNTPALFGAKLIDDLPERVIFAQERAQKVRWRASGGEEAPVGRALRLPDGRLGKFGWKAQSATLLDFVQAACANELGLGNPGAAQPTPLAMTNYKPKGLDLTKEQCEQMTAFIAALPRPLERAPQEDQGGRGAAHGRELFGAIGCAECHVANLGGLNGIYSDLLVHRMGADLVGGGSYNAPPPGVPESPGDSPLPDEWRTPPLWGVADSAPYLHDGRAATLIDAIRMHAGQASGAAGRFERLSQAQQHDLVHFLRSLRAPG